LQVQICKTAKVLTLVMPDTKPIKPTYVDLPEELKRRVKAAAAREGLLFKQAVALALRRWLTSLEGAESTENGVLENNQKLTETTPWHSVLTEILSSGHGAAIDAITRNLYAFHLLIESGDKSRATETYISPDDLARAYEETDDQPSENGQRNSEHRSHPRHRRNG
jgi:hypothetical protein